MQKLVKYDFEDGRYGTRDRCGTVMSVRLKEYLAETWDIYMSGKVANAFKNLLIISIEEETKVKAVLENEYENLLLKIKL